MTADEISWIEAQKSSEIGDPDYGYIDIFIETEWRNNELPN